MKEASHSRAQSALGGGHKSSSKSGKKPHAIHVRRGKSGGFIATHHHEPDADDGSQMPPEDHVIPDMDALHAHMDQNMGDQGAAAPSPDMAAAAGAAPAAAAPPAGPAPAGPAPAGM